MTETIQFIQTMRALTDLVMARSMKGLGHYLRARGSSLSQFFLLMHVRQHGQCGISDLSGAMDVSNAAASQQVDKLFQLGLLTRAEDPNDRRAKQITLSAKGQELIEAGINERYRWMEELSATLSDAEREQVGAALEILNDAERKLEAGLKPLSKTL